MTGGSAPGGKAEVSSGHALECRGTQSRLKPRKDVTTQNLPSGVIFLMVGLETAVIFFLIGSF